jgi:hypothetical protein
MSFYPNRVEFFELQGKADMSKILIRVALGLITIAAFSFLCVSLRGGLGPRIDARPFEASGRLMAQQALAVLEPGGQITIIARDTTTFGNPASDIQLASFRKAIDQAHVEIGTIRKLQVDPLRPIAVPSSDFCELIQNASQGSVIVSFMGPPRLTDLERSRLGEIQPAIVAFCSGRQPELADMRSLFRQGLLKAAVVDRRGAEESAPDAASQSNRSAQSFLTLTASNFPGALTGQEAKHL